VLYRHTLLDLADQSSLPYAVDLWQQAWMLMGDMREQIPTALELRALEQFARSLNASQTLITTLDETALMNVLAQTLLSLGVPGCYVVLYEDAESPRQWARLILAYTEGERIELEEGGRRFPTRQLLPEGVSPTAKPHNLLIEPLYFRDEQFGFVIFEIESSEQLTYVTLHAQISSALKGARLARQLESRARELEARNAELDAFAHTVAHDLKSPLSAMVSWGTMLQECYNEMTAEDVAIALERVVRTGFILTSIVNSLLLLSSVRQEDVATKPLDMSSIVANARNRLANAIAERQAEITMPDKWPAVLGYAPWVEEVWINLISNAAKYGGQPTEGVPPRIELGFDAPAGTSVCFWVRDNGPGLTPEEQEQLFAPFTRLHQIRIEGHGLGLSIVRRIVEKLGGKVGVESQVGEGSTFYFTLTASSP
jgi:signal transduction histidine kinase